MKIIVIGSDEHMNAGFRDYALAFGYEAMSENIQAVACKLGGIKHPHEPALKKLPIDNTGYAELPAYSEDSIRRELLQNPDRQTLIIGCGEETLEPLCALYDSFPGIPPADFAFVSHMLHPQDKTLLKGRGITAFTPSEIRGEQNLHHVKIDTVPHTMTQARIEQDYKTMLETSSNADALKRMTGLKKPFALAVLNAGFDVETSAGVKQRFPYYNDEAARDGKALGEMLPVNTSLLLMDGGPRNCHEQELEQNNAQTFMEAFRDANADANFQDGAKSRPELIYERFEKGLSYNSTAAAMHMGGFDECSAFISNAEGYGTMDSAIRFVNNQDKILGLFPFRANAEDVTGQRLDNIRKYDALGIKPLVTTDYLPDIAAEEDRLATPRPQQNSARTVLETYGFVYPEVEPTEQRSIGPGFDI